MYPKQTSKALYQNLARQCRELGIPVLEAMPDLSAGGFGVVMDAIFGFSFAGEPRPPFDAILAALKATPIPIVSVDIPSGWAVDGGPPPGGIQPHMLVSLTAPKKCASEFNGVHYVGGRFVSPAFAEKHDLVLPEYPGAEQCVRVA